MAKKRSQRRRKRKGRSRQAGGAGPKISVCMIAKDEAAFLGRCLAGIRGLADEIVVADTGSSDHTIEVARQAGARVLEVPWQGDFSLARNAVLEHAAGDWILALDCDEAIARGDWEAIRRTATGGQAAGYRMTSRNYVRESNRVGWQACDGRYAEEKDYPGWFPTTKVRLFRNDPRIRFQGALHELVEGSIQAMGGAIGDCPAPVHHYGYVEKERPAGQYAEAARRKADEEPENPEALYELALSRRDAGDLEGAREAIGRCAMLVKTGGGAPGIYLRRDFVFLVYGEILGKLGDAEGEERAYLQALEANSGCYEALNNLGTLKQRNGDLKGALDCYERALALAPEVETIRENVERVKRVQSPKSKVRSSKPEASGGDGGNFEPETGGKGERGGANVEPEGGGDGQKLSLCMIVKDEGARLGQCLESVQGLVDEIVVVDTGSSDNTVEVAERYGARMGYFEWCDDFSAARNASLKLATGDWILWLDADDLLPGEYRDTIRRLLGQGRDRAYYFVLDSQGYEPVTCLQARLFPNLPGVEFTMPIHEQITPSLARLGVRCEPTDVRVVHTGYATPEVVKEKQGRYLGIMERWLETHPGDYIVRSHAAMTYYIWGELDRAIEYYGEILHESDCRKDRNLVIETTALLYLGRCYMRKEDYGRALPFLLDAQKVDDRYSVTNLTLGECYTKMGRPEDAIAALEQARAFEDQVTFSATYPQGLKYSIRFFMGQNLEASGRLEEALDWYRQALGVDANRSGALGALSTVYRKLGRREEAVQALERALQLDPGNAKHRFNRGTFHLEAGAEAEAERWFREALEVDPEMPEPYLNLGFLARRRGDAQAAEEMYRKASDLNPSSYEPPANLGHLLLDQGRYAEVADCFARVREMQPGLLDITLGLCVAQAAKGQTEAVRPLVAEALQAVYGGELRAALPPGMPAGELSQLLAECGRMLLQKQLPVCARLGFLAAHLLHPDSAGVALQLAEVYRATGEAWRAVPIYEALIQKSPDEPELFRKLGACYEAMGVPEAARMCAEKAAALEA